MGQAIDPVVEWLTAKVGLYRRSAAAWRVPNQGSNRPEYCAEQAADADRQADMAQQALDRLTRG